MALDINNEYIEIKDGYQNFLKGVERVVAKILDDNNIPTIFKIYGRLKDVNSIKEKYNSKRFNLKKTITELDDLVGLRIVLLFPEYKDVIKELLVSEFKGVKIRDIKTKSPNQFGYSSLHLILGIKDEWAGSYEWKDHKDKKIEVQIRTLSEHIWAETSHALFYKNEESIPDIIKRDLYKLSALLEVVDEKLGDIKGNVKEHFEYIKTGDYKEILKLDLNLETFRRIMVENSNGIYDLDDLRNNELSAYVESEYNILNAALLDNIIKEQKSKTYESCDLFLDDLSSILKRYHDDIKKEQKERELK